MPQVRSWSMDTALHSYARGGQVYAARMQLRHGADTEICNAQGFTPLLLAARYNQLEVLQVLLQHGARTDAVAPLDGDFGHGVELGTCLHFAAESGHVEIIKFLITAAALDVDERTRGFQEITALQLAARLGRVDVVRFLTRRRDVDVNARDAYGMTPLHHACDYPNTEDGVTQSPPTQYLSDASHVDVVEALVQAGAVLDIRRSNDRATALRCALRRGHFLVAKALVERGAYTGVAKWVHKLKTALSSRPWTHEASEPSTSKRTLWQRHSSTLQRDSSLWETEFSTVEDPAGLRTSLLTHEPALLAACKSQSRRRLSEALKGPGGLDINCRSSLLSNAGHEGWTALHLAASSGWKDGVSSLIAHGANVELTTTQYPRGDCGTTALHLAAQNGHISIVSALLDAGADIDACDDLGETSLMCALRHGRSRTVKELMRHGADCGFQNDSPPLSGPPRSNESESLFSSFHPQSTTALHFAAFFGALPLVEELAKSSTSLLFLDAVDTDGATPIWLAALMGHLDVVDFLAQHGADIHHEVGGDSLSDCAAEFGHLEIVEYVSTSSPARQIPERRSLSHLVLHDRHRVHHRNGLQFSVELATN